MANASIAEVRCVACGKQGLSLRRVEFLRARGRFIENADSSTHTYCPRHRYQHGLLMAGRALLVDLVAVGPAPMVDIAFHNLKGGHVVPGETADLMLTLAAEFTRQGKREDAEQANQLAAKFSKRMDEELATLERQTYDEQRRL